MTTKTDATEKQIYSSEKILNLQKNHITKSSVEQRSNASFQLKGRLFTLSVLQLQNMNAKQLDKELAGKIKLAPKFFEHAPVVIDVSKIRSKNKSENNPENSTENKPKDDINFKELKAIIEKHGLIPVGVKGTTQTSNKSAQEAGFAIMTDHSTPNNNNTQPNSSATTQKSTTGSDNNTQEQEPKHYSKLVTQPIRSGQQVYSPGDLVIVSSVSPGAELLAEGNIHVYGTLRGRALAGINGLKSARIFCHQLEAELVSIAGQYKIFEDIQEHHDQTPKQLYLDDTRLVISSLQK
jgi:septum site-determining protein MinC